MKKGLAILLAVFLTFTTLSVRIVLAEPEEAQVTRYTAGKDIYGATDAFTAPWSLDSWELQYLKPDEGASWQTFSYPIADYHMWLPSQAGEWQGIEFGGGDTALWTLRKNGYVLAPAWVAPADGMVRVGSGDIKIPAGGEAQCRVTLDGAPAWAFGADSDGWITLTADGAYEAFTLAVTAGQVLRFEMQRTDEAEAETLQMTWNPSVDFYNTAAVAEQTGAGARALGASVNSCGNSFALDWALEYQKAGETAWKDFTIYQSDYHLWRPFYGADSMGVEFGSDGKIARYNFSKLDYYDPSGMTVAGTWTAPADGCLSVPAGSIHRTVDRSETVKCRVSHNGETAWSLGADSDGWVENKSLAGDTAYAAFTVDVERGDKVRFEMQCIAAPQGATLSVDWNPSVSFLAAEQSRVQAVIDAIAAIGTVTLDKEAAIVAAEAAYKALSSEQQALVTNHATLVAARQALDDLKAGGDEPTPEELAQTDFIMAKDIYAYGDTMKGPWWALEYTNSDTPNWTKMSYYNEHPEWKDCRWKPYEDLWNLSILNYRGTLGVFEFNNLMLDEHLDEESETDPFFQSFVLAATWTAQKAGRVTINGADIQQEANGRSTPYGDETTPNDFAVRISCNGEKAWNLGDEDGWYTFEHGGSNGRVIQKYTDISLGVAKGDKIRFEVKMLRYTTGNGWLELRWNPSLTLMEATEADKQAGQAVTDQIAAIGEVTLDKEAAIKAAEEAYRALSPEQRSFVTNYDVLVKAQKELSYLKEETQKTYTLGKDVFQYGDTFGRVWALEYKKLDDAAAGWKPFELYGSAYHQWKPYYTADGLAIEFGGDGSIARWVINNSFDYFDATNFVGAATWTAPADGTIRLDQGTIGRPEGELNTVFCRVSKNDETAWGKGKDNGGWGEITIPELYKSIDIEVKKGDKIRFEIRCSDFEAKQYIVADWNPSFTFYRVGEEIDGPSGGDDDDDNPWIDGPDDEETTATTASTSAADGDDGSENGDDEDAAETGEPFGPTAAMLAVAALAGGALLLLRRRGANR